MIILRIGSKLFSWYKKHKRKVILKKEPRRDPPPPRFPIPKEWEKYPRTTLVIYTKRYSDDMRMMGPRRDNVRAAVQELKDGYYDSDDPINVAKGIVFDTHVLLDFSKINKYRRFTKSINNFDRIDYLVYRPILINEIVYTPIVITSCLGHEIAGLRSYTEIENNEETEIQES